MKLTYKELKAKDPCNDQFEIYKANFPNNCKVTKRGILKAVELNLDLDWFANKFLPAPAWKACNKATEPAWEAYQKATEPAWEAYQKAIASAWEAYNKTTASALWKIIKGIENE